MKKAQYLALVGVGSLLSMSVHASKFNMDVDGGFLTGSSDIYDASGLSLQGRYFSKALTTTNGPLAENAFLQQAGYINFGFTNTDEDTSDSLVENNRRFISLGGKFIQEDWIYGLNYQRVDLEAKSNDPGFPINVDVSGEIYDLEFGRYLTKDWSVTATLIRLDIGEGSAENGYELSTKKLVTLPSKQNLSLEASWLDIDDARRIGIEGDFYINDKLSVGASLADWDSNDFDNIDTETSVRTQYFITDMAAVSLRYTDAEFLLPGEVQALGETWLISGQVRF